MYNSDCAVAVNDQRGSNPYTQPLMSPSVLHVMNHVAGSAHSKTVSHPTVGTSRVSCC